MSNPLSNYLSQLNNAPELGLRYPFAQEPLPYGYNEMEPHIDTRTMVIHYNRHHKAYTDNFNKFVVDNNLQNSTLIEIFIEISRKPDGLKNNGGGFFNHLVFWKMLRPNPNSNPNNPIGEIATKIDQTFTNFDTFKSQFSSAAMGRFGSGWAWLNVRPNGELFISSTPNQDCPLMDTVTENGLPLLGIDVWEHAYYLKYQNLRADYVVAFWHLVNWDEVERRYQEAKNIFGF